MPDSLLLIAAIVFYVMASAFIVFYLRSVTGDDSESKEAKIRLSFAAAIGAVGFHIAYASKISLVDHTLNFSLSSMLVLVSALLCVIFLLGGLIMPIRRLGILVFPLTILSLVFAFFWKDQLVIFANRGLAFDFHVVISILSYSLLAIAAIQALLYSYQERQIKNRTNPAMLMALPPLQTMELLLFRLVGIGFFMLSLTLLSGAIFSREIFGHPFTFTHHTVLALLGWIVFALLLFKRIGQGLRGSQAVIWTISGFLLIQLGYFGTKIVSESLSLQ